MAGRATLTRAFAGHILRNDPVAPSTVPAGIAEGAFSFSGQAVNAPRGGGLGMQAHAVDIHTTARSKRSGMMVFSRARQFRFG